MANDPRERQRASAQTPPVCRRGMIRTVSQQTMESRDRAGTPLLRILAPEIQWTIPGKNRIAGMYRGIDEVLAYFARRETSQAAHSPTHRRDVLVGQTNRVAALTDGTATIQGLDHHWSTVGLYDIDEQNRIVACWLLAIDQHAFDEIWSQ